MGKIRHLDTHVGKIFGPYQVLRRSNRYVKNNTVWVCKCLKCYSQREMFYSNLTRIKKCTCNFQLEPHLLNAIFATTAQSAKRRNLEFNLNKEYLLELLKRQKFTCSLSGLEIQVGRYHKKIETTASIDRIDSTKGYIEGNVQWVHKDINKMKNNFTDKDFIIYCKAVAENN